MIIRYCNDGQHSLEVDGVQDLTEIILAADQLGIECLKASACQALEELIRGMEMKEIKQFFMIESGLVPDSEEEEKEPTH